jgi:hypothetical protein
MALPLDNGTGTLKRVDGAPNKLVAYLTNARMMLQPLKDGEVLIPPQNVPGIEQVNVNAMYKVFVGGYDENPGDWLIEPGHRLTFTGANSPSMLTGEYIVVQQSGPHEAAGLDHVRFLVQRTAA